MVIGLLQFGIDKGAEGCHTDLSHFLQPHITINASTFVEPALLQRSVGTHADQVRFTILHIGRDVIHLRRIAAGFSTHIEAIKPYTGIAEDAIKAQHEALAKVGSGNRELLAIPAHTALRIFPPHGLVAVRVAGLSSIGQRRHPVVRQLHILPFCIVKLQ